MEACSISEIFRQLNNESSLLSVSISQSYANQEVVPYKKQRLYDLLSHSSFDPDIATIVSRCPGRISFSKHADYINNDLLYCLDDRDIFIAVQKNHVAAAKRGQRSEYQFFNTDDRFEPLSINVYQLENFNAQESSKQHWAYYLTKSLELIMEKFKSDISFGLTFVVDSDLPGAGGLSSSHALTLSSIIAIAETLQISSLLEQIANKDLRILELCQKVEQSRGFQSGLGDQAAQLICPFNSFAFVKLLPRPEYKTLLVPNELQIITTPSFIKADKNLAEFAAANESIARYSELNSICSGLFPGIEYLGDALYHSREDEVFSKIQNSLKEDPKLLEIALYGLAEGARLKYLKELALTHKNSITALEKDIFAKTLGAHLNLSHLAELHNREDSTHSSKLAKSKEFFATELARSSGYYGASTPTNDALQLASINSPMVYGSSISGAGLGGNNIVLTHKAEAKDFKNYILENYYAQRADANKVDLSISDGETVLEMAEQEVYLSSSSAPACRLV